MGALAGLALAVTVLYAQHALNDATDVVARGDGDTVISAVIVDLWEAESLDSETLTSVIEKHQARRLRYVGLVDRHDRHVIVEAGTATIEKSSYMPGETIRRGKRVRLVSLIPFRAETRACRWESAKSCSLNWRRQLFFVIRRSLHFEHSACGSTHGLKYLWPFCAIACARTLLSHWKPRAWRSP